MGSTRGTEKDRVILFGRYPEPGKNKTRLIPALGPAGAADLQKRLTENLFEVLKPLVLRSGIGIEVCLSGGTEVLAQRWLGGGVRWSHQGPGNLGDRMRAAFSRAFQQGCRRVLLLGTDIPGVTFHHVEQAFQALVSHDLVLGPSTDGGYWLMGLKQPVELFHGMTWGAGGVLEDTLSAATRQGLKTVTLGPLTDVDTIEDLMAVSPEWFPSGPYLSVIIPALNESGRIERVVKRALDRDAEIIVADGGSGDDTAERAEKAGAHVLSAPPGRALQQNFAARRAGGRMLLFLHADTLLPADYVTHVFETMMPRGTAAGAFRFKTNLNRPLMKTVEIIANLRSRFFRLPYGDQALFMRRDLFELIGGFLEVPIAEDLFLVRELARRGRIRIARAEAVTSARRWRRIGVIRTTLINQIILAGCILGVPPRALTGLYGGPRKGK